MPEKYLKLNQKYSVTFIVGFYNPCFISLTIISIKGGLSLELEQYILYSPMIQQGSDLAYTLSIHVKQSLQLTDFFV